MTTTAGTAHPAASAHAAVAAASVPRWTSGLDLAVLGARDRVQAVVRAYETGLVRAGG